ncbi:MAG: hypothetical protein EBZ77_17280 [Chitinophagia bacterium]|nr:hypothetical protein [Chitinophagia bacterium]
MTKSVNSSITMTTNVRNKHENTHHNEDEKLNVSDNDAKAAVNNSFHNHDHNNKEPKVEDAIVILDDDAAHDNDDTHDKNHEKNDEDIGCNLENKGGGEIRGEENDQDVDEEDVVIVHKVNLENEKVLQSTRREEDEGPRPEGTRDVTELNSYKEEDENVTMHNNDVDDIIVTTSIHTIGTGNLEHMSLRDLRKMCADQGLVPHGKKSELIARLRT